MCTIFYVFQLDAVQSMGRGGGNNQKHRKMEDNASALATAWDELQGFWRNPPDNYPLL